MAGDILRVWCTLQLSPHAGALPEYASVERLTRRLPWHSLSRAASSVRHDVKRIEKISPILRFFSDSWLAALKALRSALGSTLPHSGFFFTLVLQVGLCWSSSNSTCVATNHFQSCSHLSGTWEKDRTPGLFFHSLLPGIELRGIVQIFLVALQDLVLLGFHEGNKK